MKKNIKLSSKKLTEKTPKKTRDTRFFFIKDQGEGAVRVLIIIFKLLELFTTTVYALCIGIIAPLMLLIGKDEINYTAAAVPWLIASLLYIAGLFLMIFNRSKTGAVIHMIAAVFSLITYGSFLNLFKKYEDYQTPANMFMPCLVITALSISIALMLNIPIWWERYLEKLNEKAPSILGDDNENKENTP